MKWHPDQYKGQERKQAEKRFIDIAHAKEVLSDPGNDSHQSLTIYSKLLDVVIIL